MKPPYDITPLILKRVASISEKIGRASAVFIDKPSPQLRKRNRIKTIHSSLQIEGNTLSEDQVTALMDKQRVRGPSKDVQEVLNAIRVYDELTHYRPNSEKDFLKAHRELMSGLEENAGKYRTKGVAIVKGKNIEHIAPPHHNVPFLMKELFMYLQKSDELVLIRSCVFHYELEFIHPFMDGNGRMGRLWQTLILLQDYPVFEALPFESLISKSQKEYYKALAASDKAGNSTVFIEYMLGIIEQSLDDLLSFNSKTMKHTDRLDYFISLGKNDFTRKDYMNVFKHLSSASASRDLKKGLELDLFQAKGSGNKTTYFFR